MAHRTNHHSLSTRVALFAGTAVGFAAVAVATSAGAHSDTNDDTISSGGPVSSSSGGTTVRDEDKPTGTELTGSNTDSVTPRPDVWRSAPPRQEMTPSMTEPPVATGDDWAPEIGQSITSVYDVKPPGAGTSVSPLDPRGSTLFDIGGWQ
ncbi:hypothetical protein [Mycolicibacterium sp. CR10]|uniref:hypothetical protein n=1 Tax=Mycolicibacterium sp. CR10 TaxID=2562314 RepID=UPI0010C04972|nr:hypothetical protein [Mycolicibacterium sp. CR10]